MADPKLSRPALYQVNTRVYLGERSRELRRQATLDDVPDAFLDQVAQRGFRWLWFLGVWTTGLAARSVSRSRGDWREGFARDLPNLTDADISGSPFAIQAYEVSPEYGGEAALQRLRTRLDRRGIRLMLDFVPNHVSPDHPWVVAHPEYFIHGTQDDLAREPSNWTRTAAGVLACGRDPYFPGWPDTVQLNYRHAGLREAMRTTLGRVAERCDGVRCDMAMLILPDVIQRTWGERALPQDGSHADDKPFWPEAIHRVRMARPGFVFMAEVYWDLEFTLQEQGFDFTYDKRLYDRLHAGDAGPVRRHLWAVPGFQERSARFLENHDEPRAATTFPPEKHRAAAVISFFVPGLRFFHEGQLEGRRVHVSMHLARRPDEPVDREILAFYEKLLTALQRDEVHTGKWRLCECAPAWPANPSHEQFVVMAWEGAQAARLLAVANYAPTPAQCYAQMPFMELPRKVLLRDLLSDARYVRDAADLRAKGLYLDVPAWGHHAFAVEPG
jgi:hypothetical protein